MVHSLEVIQAMNEKVTPKSKATPKRQYMLLMRYRDHSGSSQYPKLIGDAEVELLEWLVKENFLQEEALVTTVQPDEAAGS